MAVFFKKQNSESDKLNKVSKLTNLVDGVNAIFDNNQNPDDTIFESIARSINRITGAKVVIVGKYKHLSEEIETLAFWDNERLMPNYTYKLANTPCQTIIGNQPCSYPVNVSKIFPLDMGLVKRNIEAYVGIPLFYSENKPMGLLSAMFDHELVDFRIVESLLRIYGIRVGSEMEHMEYHELLQSQNIELNLLFVELQKKNIELDKYIIEVEKAHKAAEESNQLKSAFLANLSHEVRTPMNVMLGFSELLKSNYISHEERVEYIDIINQNGIQLLKIMDNLIDISKFQSKKLVENPKPVKLNQLLDQFFGNYLEYIRVVQKPLRLFLEKGLSDASDFIVTDQDGLSKILNQLLDNSVKFTSEGWIKFGYDQIDNDIVFYVKDTGVGVPEGMEEVVFEMFRQADLRASREFGGNGLGLAIARKYAEILGGNIWIQPDAGCSSCFCFKIPYIKVITK
jgi:signal transduction histidine kinase